MAALNGSLGRRPWDLPPAATFAWGPGASTAWKVYNFWRIKRWTEVWHQLPEEERDRIFGEVKKNLEAVGGEWLLRCRSSWANDAYRSWGINVYPSLEAALEDGENLRKMGFWRYVESESMLGVPREE